MLSLMGKIRCIQLGVNVMLQQMNRYLEKALPFMTPTSVILGILLSSYIIDYAFLVPWIFALITFNGSLKSNFQSLKQVITHPLPMLVALIILHIIMPIWAFLLGHLVFPGDVFTITGLVLAVVIPTGVTSMIWVSIYSGNTVLTLAIVIIDTILSPFIVPFSVSLFTGSSIEIDILSMMNGLITMIVIPSLIAMFLNQATKGKIADVWAPRLAPFAKIAVAVVVMLNSSKIAPYVLDINFKLILTAFIVLMIAASGYLLSWYIGKLLKWKKEDVVTLTFTGGMRNISAGAVIAVTFFPPAVAVPVILGMLFQQMLASFYGTFISKYYRKHPEEEITAVYKI